MGLLILLPKKAQLRSKQLFEYNLKREVFQKAETVQLRKTASWSTTQVEVFQKAENGSTSSKTVSSSTTLEVFQQGGKKAQLRSKTALFKHSSKKKCFRRRKNGSNLLQNSLLLRSTRSHVTTPSLHRHYAVTTVTTR